MALDYNFHSNLNHHYFASRKYEPYTHFMLPENGKIDSSLQMQALAMQYLSPEQAVKCKWYPSL